MLSYLISVLLLFLGLSKCHDFVLSYMLEKGRIFPVDDLQSLQGFTRVNQCEVVEFSDEGQELLFKVLCRLLFLQLILEFSNKLTSEREILNLSNPFVLFTNLIIIVFAHLVLISNFVVAEFLVHFVLHLFHRKI